MSDKWVAAKPASDLRQNVLLFGAHGQNNNERRLSSLGSDMPGHLQSAPMFLAVVKESETVNNTRPHVG